MPPGWAPAHPKPNSDPNPHGEGDRILVIAEDDDKYRCEAVAFPEPSPLPAYHKPAPRSERVLFCGWRRDIGDMITLLNDLAQPGSQLDIMCEIEEADRLKSIECVPRPSHHRGRGLAGSQAVTRLSGTVGETRRLQAWRTSPSAMWLGIPRCGIT